MGRPDPQAIIEGQINDLPFSLHSKYPLAHFITDLNFHVNSSAH
jgi:hypothetical protein